MKNLSGKIEDISAELVEGDDASSAKKDDEAHNSPSGGVRKSQSQPESDADEIWRGFEHISKVAVTKIGNRHQYHHRNMPFFRPQSPILTKLMNLL
ncbi:hypothetical protein Ocin01_14945 [Orchesella cincta]|uniref:Uncharacterized protein n=1 Tax=Orchesella cincta TaxID=48709 RepID=A0A1D2MFH0_ORCCI|nr:hypothetical protein Ocin01_14945 [Orchesella cincta]